MEVLGYFMLINAACVVVAALAACVGVWKFSAGGQIGFVSIGASALACFVALVACTLEYSFLGRTFLEDGGWLNPFLLALAIGLLGVLLVLRRTVAPRAPAGSQG